MKISDYSSPYPVYTLAHEIAPGRFRPTMTHAFIRLLSDKGLLHTHFTQNIDTLERRAGVPESKIVEAHGSFATSRCVDCQKPFPQDEMKSKIAEKSIPHCALCGGLAKPEIVFFGEAVSYDHQHYRSHLVVYVATRDLFQKYLCVTRG